MHKILVLAVIAVSIASSALAEVNVNVNVGVPGPRVLVPPPGPPPSRVIVSGPPAVMFEAPPLFVAPSGLGFYVGVDTPYDIIYSSNYYYLYYGNSWHRSRHHNGPWSDISYRSLPPGIRKHRLEQIRSYRDREYRVYRDDRDHYRGQTYRPEHVRREEIREERREDHRRDNNEWKYDSPRGRTEWMEEKRREHNQREHEQRGRD